MNMETVVRNKKGFPYSLPSVGPGADPVIEAGSQIQAGSLAEAGGSKGEYHRANCT